MPARATILRKEQTVSQRRIETPLGPMIARARPSGILSLDFADHTRAVSDESAADHADATRHLDRLQQELTTYFRGEPVVFSVPLDPIGTPFQHAVWNVLRTIPWGERASYAWVANRVGRPDAVRAVGAANGANTIAIVVPCHRVVGSDGTLTGYAGGLDRKRRLLEIESAAGLFAGTAPLTRSAAC